ncbi:hypothetical protein ACFPZL_02400 [Leucobacter soli]|uniref:Lipoprotein n=1 Tax=Leucobacter soli TaxID=2812850 RepID=A0A916JS00_9MICO|nr:hypothetical protein [Leucobacter soli]CAG7599090.1 hypothetical protein LEUCIP111803_00268 [Leucobacter soli]
MPTTKLLRVCTTLVGALAGAVLLTGLTSCGVETAQLDPENRPTMAPEQSTDEACAEARAGIDALVADAREQLEAAGTSVAAGEMPDLTGLQEQMQRSIDTIAEGVSNSEVLAAIDGVRAEIDGFAELSPPESILGMPGYLAELGGQAGDLQSAAEALRTLCKAD